MEEPKNTVNLNSHPNWKYSNSNPFFWQSLHAISLLFGTRRKKTHQYFCFKSVCLKTLGGKFTKQLSPVRCSCHLHCPNYPPDLQMAKGGQEGQGGVILLLPFGYCYYQTVLPLWGKILPSYFKSKLGDPLLAPPSWTWGLLAARMISEDMRLRWQPCDWQHKEQKELSEKKSQLFNL